MEDVVYCDYAKYIFMCVISASHSFGECIGKSLTLIIRLGTETLADS